MKKAISLILVVVLISVTALPAFAETGTANSDPIIMVGGRSNSVPIYNTDGENVNHISLDKDYISEAVKECLPLLAKGMLTGNYQPWVDKVMEFYAPIYTDLLPDENGEITNGTKPGRISGTGTLYGGYNGYKSNFGYDWREDPYKTADLLNNEIQQLKAKTGKSKVSIVGRCYGGNVVTAYLDKYGCEDVNTVVFYCSAAAGAAGVGCCFSGHFDIDSKAFENYTENTPMLDDPALDELLYSTLAYVNSFYGFVGTTDAMNFIVKILFPIIAPELLRASYGRFASFWAMVSDPYYDEAKKIVFDGVEEEYQGLIEIIDRYHIAQQNLANMLKEYEKAGMSVAVVSKYNSVLAPVIERANMQSDNTVELALASFGATAADYGKTLSHAYLLGKDMDYVSSDRIVDASTCAFRNRTWFIKDIAHEDIPTFLDKMIVKICQGGKNYNVYTDENYPQFMKYDKESKTFSALDDEPIESSISLLKGVKTIYDKFKAFVQALVNVIKQVLIDSEQEASDA